MQDAMTGKRRLVSSDGVTAFYETNGHWIDEAGDRHFKVVGTDVFPTRGGGRAFYIVGNWAFDETGAMRYYYGR